MTWALLLRYWWAAPIAALAIALFVTRGTLADRTQDLADERAAHQQTVASYWAAATEASRKDAANRQRVDAEQNRISKEITDDYEARIADVRARAERLRRDAEARAGDRADAPVPAAGAAAGGADEAACEDRLPAAGLGLDDALVATEQAIQLDELINWVEAQARVDIGNEAAP
ncbi:hypothetical protein DFR49_2298 [Hephaestia caeni]|uniref:Bacteriophage Rz lysis protein n=1 Tax=Hephaestia caeni TaxID=645617 RepID=A0A397P489_9SPHN|nr:hypothetical protein [Hephaestia caeni]RIA44062.1 hypothetical protein DFR49_2298 [Hephaestia caeni]